MSTDRSNDAASTDEYLSLESGAGIELKVKGSRFLAEAGPVQTEDEARERLSLLRHRHHDATHHCSAWRIGPPERCVERSDDDGEPSGTAGRPILAALQREKLFDAFVVVTRYFGGTKLGSGGLVRAYGEAAALALAANGKRRVFLCEQLAVRCNYETSGLVETLLAKREEILREVRREFGDGPCYRLSVLRSHAGRLRADLIEHTAGKIEFDEA